MPRVVIFDTNILFSAIGWKGKSDSFETVQLVMRNTLYLPTGDSRSVTPQNGRQFTILELSELVGGHPFALVLEDSGTAMVGVIGQHAPINHAATEITQHWIGPYCEAFGRNMHCPIDQLPPEILPGGSTANA